jgi:hypothetical protein
VWRRYFKALKTFKALILKALALLVTLKVLAYTL